MNMTINIRCGKTKLTREQKVSTLIQYLKQENQGYASIPECLFRLHVAFLTKQIQKQVCRVNLLTLREQSGLDPIFYQFADRFI